MTKWAVEGVGVASVLMNDNGFCLGITAVWLLLLDSSKDKKILIMFVRNQPGKM